MAPRRLKARSKTDFEIYDSEVPTAAPIALPSTASQLLLPGAKQKDKENIAPLTQNWLDSQEDGQSLERLLLSDLNMDQI